MAIRFVNYCYEQNYYYLNRHNKKENLMFSTAMPIRIDTTKIIFNKTFLISKCLAVITEY